MTATCAVHADIAAVASCLRCSRACCQPCLRSGGLCLQCALEVNASLPSLDHRARLASYGLWCFAASQAGVVFILIVRLSILTAPLMLSFLVSLVVSAVLVCRWLHLAVRHALARGIAVGGSPAAAVLSALVPVANYFVPFQFVRRMLKAMKLPTDQLLFSQVLTIMSAVFGALARLDPEGVASMTGGLSYAAQAGSAVTAAWAIRSLRFE